MSPPLLQIPPRYIPSLAAFLRLAPEDLTAFLGALHTENPTLSLEDLAETVAPRLSSIDPKIVTEILDLLGSLYLAREALGTEMGEFISGVRGAMERSGKAELQTSDWTAFEKSLREALSSGSALTASAKAIGVLSDHPKAFLSSRILTDLRPIFGSNVEEPPEASVIVHTLKITYREGRTTREFFVSMDGADLVKLCDDLKRATKKEESLRGLTKSKGLKLLEIKT